MSTRNRRKEWMGVIGTAGAAAFLAGPLGGLYHIGLAIVIAFAIWSVGATLVIALTNPPE